MYAWTCSVTLGNQQSFRPIFLHFLIGYRPQIDSVTPKLILSVACSSGPVLGELQPLGSVEKLSCIRCQPRGNKCSSPSPGMQGWKEAVIYPPQLCSSLWNPSRLENTSKSKVAFAFRRPRPRAQWAHLLFPVSRSPHQSRFGGCVALVFYFFEYCCHSYITPWGSWLRMESFLTLKWVWI